MAGNFAVTDANEEVHYYDGFVNPEVIEALITRRLSVEYISEAISPMVNQEGVFVKPVNKVVLRPENLRHIYDINESKDLSYEVLVYYDPSTSDLDPHEVDSQLEGLARERSYNTLHLPNSIVQQDADENEIITRLRIPALDIWDRLRHVRWILELSVKCLHPQSRDNFVYPGIDRRGHYKLYLDDLLFKEFYADFTSDITVIRNFLTLQPYRDEFEKMVATITKLWDEMFSYVDTNIYSVTGLPKDTPEFLKFLREFNMRLQRLSHILCVYSTRYVFYLLLAYKACKRRQLNRDDEDRPFPDERLDGDPFFLFLNPQSSYSSRKEGSLYILTKFVTAIAIHTRLMLYYIEKVNSKSP